MDNKLTIEELKEIGLKVSLDTFEFDHEQDKLSETFGDFNDNYGVLRENKDIILKYVAEELQKTVEGDTFSLSEVKDSIEIPDGWRLVLAEYPAMSFPGQLVVAVEGNDIKPSEMLERFSHFPAGWLYLLNTVSDGEALNMKANLCAEHFGFTKNDEFFRTCQIVHVTSMMTGSSDE